MGVRVPPFAPAFIFRLSFTRGVARRLPRLAICRRIRADGNGELKGGLTFDAQSLFAPPRPTCATECFNNKLWPCLPSPTLPSITLVSMHRFSCSCNSMTQVQDLPQTLHGYCATSGFPRSMLSLPLFLIPLCIMMSLRSTSFIASPDSFNLWPPFVFPAFQRSSTLAATRAV